MKKFILILILLSAFLSAFGCSRKMEGGKTLTSSQAMMSDAAYAWEWAGYTEGPAGVEGQTPPAFRDMSNLYGRVNQEAAPSRAADTSSSDSMSANLDNVERKLVKRATIRIRAENLEAADASVAELMAKYGAYSASTDIEENARRYSLRVPSNVYDSFLAEMNGLGRLLRRSETVEDVTLRYYDLEGRLATKKELLRTFQSYLGRARNIEEILSVEARISELQSDIEGTGLQLRNLANRIDYATIELNIIGPVSSTPKNERTLGERIKGMFADFGSFLSVIVIAVVGIIIYGIPILLLVVLLFWLFFGRIGLIKKLWRKVEPEKIKQ
jgi:hypothetical protein